MGQIAQAIKESDNEMGFSIRETIAGQKDYWVAWTKKIYWEENKYSQISHMSFWGE